MHKDNPLLGVLLMLGFCVVAPMGDAVAKLLGDRVPIGQLLFVRFGVQALVLLPIVALTGRIWRMHGRVLWLTLLRTLLHILGIGMMFSALRYLPLADAIAIAFIMPFLMLLLGHFVLGEEVGMRRMLACAVGFAGTLMVVQPAFQEVGWPALLPLGVAVNFSMFMLVTRQIARDTDPIGLQAVSGVMAVAIIAPLLLFVPDLGTGALTWIAPNGTTWTLLLSIGLLGTLAHLLMTWSLRFAPGATLAPMQYLEIPIATVIGLVVFGDLPNGLAMAGICVTLAAGLYIVMRERAMMRAATPAPIAPVPGKTAAE
ncbi:DMT family transporter [Thalassococcus profundi]|uniref:DMT family transporter n=1 Tax=Thalassococcus profundi TaxID=2282382 RepID=A0A369THY0_9RHOB|nr:DMT family transporter [Thalassococcus profundi]RDD64840.1 DMT family transporter [Thalassococcus profundi]